MKYLIIIALFTLILPERILAQSHSFLTEGQIVYERKVNVYAALDSILTKGKQVPQEAVPQIISGYKLSNPQFSTRTFYLDFSDNISLYKPSEEKDANAVSFLNQASFKNTVYTDLVRQQAFTEKFFFDHPVFIQDSLRKIKWRMTDETRTIANYLCRRANAVIMDSIYVVAYYTDQIITKSGPESFTGLPGMILGLAIPDEHVTWFATSVTAGLKEQIRKPGLTNEKDKPITQQEFKRSAIKFLDEHSAHTHWFATFLLY